MKKLVIALLSLTCFASPVSAGCAWVLWETDVFEESGVTKVVVPESAFESRQDCLNEQTKKEQFRDSEFAKKYQKDKGISWSFTCLPDTVDLRGVKGK